MSAVAITGSAALRPPGFRSPARSRRWAWVAFVWSVAVGVACFVRAQNGDVLDAAGGLAIVVPLFAIALATLALAVRLARLSVDSDGVHWGWGSLGFSMAASRIATARLHPNAVVLSQKGRFFWCLSGRDWAPFPAVLDAFRKAGLPVEERTDRAPIRARLQAYGLALDLILVVNVLLVTACWLL